MKTIISQVFWASLALGSAVPTKGKHHHAIGNDDFIKVDGLRLYDSKGALHYLTGAVFSKQFLSILTLLRNELLGLYELGCQRRGGR